MRVHRVEQVLLLVALVDHPAHALGGGLGRDGEAALAHALDLLAPAAPIMVSVRSEGSEMATFSGPNSSKKSSSTPLMHE